MQIINVDLVPGKVMPILHASQFDKGRSLGVKLYNGGAVFELSGAEDLTAAVRKPDGNIVTETLTNAGGSLVEIITTEQMTACAGGSLCEIKIENAGDVIGTANFVLEVEKDPTDGGIESASEIDNLATQIADINNDIVPPLVAAEVANQYDSANVIFDNEPTTGHGTGYAVTSAGLKSYVPKAVGDLSDVNINNPQLGEALVFDAQGNVINGTVSTVGSIDDLNDVDTTGKANADSLRYNATAQEWEAKPTTVEMTLAEYEALGGDYSGYENTNIIITDAPNLNATAKEISYEGSTDTVWDKVDGILHPVKIWSGSKYTLNDYIDIPDFDKDTIYMFEFMAFSGTYHTCFVSPVGDGYLQFVIWGDNTQHCRYRVQINTNSGRLTIVDVMNGGANQALVAIYSII